MSADNDTRLVADIGGTNARFALADRAGTITAIETFQCADFAGLTEAVRAYQVRHPTPVYAFAAAVACPVQGDRVALTNGPWTFSIKDLRRDLNIERLLVINDFEAQALAVPQLADNDSVQIGGGKASLGGPVVVVGPGTGLGVAGLVSEKSGGVRAVCGEGGHVAWAPLDDRQVAVHHLLKQRFGRVSLERLLSGAGIVNLYRAFCDLNGVSTAPLSPVQVGDRAARDTCRSSADALDLFFSVLGAACGDFALTYGATGGVYIAGGIVPRLLPALTDSAFRASFEDKGRFRSHVAAMPTYVVTAQQPGLIGVAAALAQDGREAVARLN